MNRVFIFDMDGVLIDSVRLHYDAYSRFLAGFGIKGSDQEFGVLNGKNIREIISCVKERHDLRGDDEELLAQYDRQMQVAYTKAPLTPGVTRSLQLLKRQCFTTALASASKRENIDYIVQKYKLKSYFDLIVSGDQVTKAKPSPEIYQLVRSRFGNREYYVLEDSEQGIESALAARMHVIRFDPMKRSVRNKAAGTISRMNEMAKVIDGIQKQCRTIATHRHVEARITTQHRIAPSPQQERAGRRLWKQAQRRNPSLFDDKIISYHSYRMSRKTLSIECVLTRYRHFIARLRDPALRLPVFPLSVAGALVDEHGNTLMGKRTEKVTEYKGCYEFVPSGGISADKISRGRVLFKRQLEEEFTEEVGLPLTPLRAIEPFSLTLDVKHQLYVILCTLKLKGDLHAMSLTRRRSEHDALHVIKRSQLKRFVASREVVPTSWLIAERIAT